MVRYGRRKIGRSFFHKRYFVLEPRLLAYYKKKPSENEVPIKSLLINPNCRVEDRGLETHHGHMVYVLSVYNKKDKSNHIVMASFKLQEVCLWKKAIEQVIEQSGNLQTENGNNQISKAENNGNMAHKRTTSSSDCEGQDLPAQEDDKQWNFAHSRACGNGLPDTFTDMSNEAETKFTYPALPEIGSGSRKQWRLVRCQNGLRIFEEIPDDYTLQSHTRAMKAVGVVEAKCEDIFSLIIGMDEIRNEWDSTFHSCMSVEEVNGHTAILYHRLQLDWCSWLVWPRDLCYVRYWRRNDDGSYVIVFRSKEHPNCPSEPGCVRAHIESGGFTILPLKPRKGFGGPRARVEHQIQIDLKGWGVGYLPFYQQHCLLQMLNSVAGLREWFAQSDEGQIAPQLNRIMKMTSELTPAKSGKRRQSDIQHTDPFSNICDAEDDSDDEEDGPAINQETFYENSTKENMTTNSSTNFPVEETMEALDWSAFPSSVSRDDRENARNCWSIPNGNNFRVRSKLFSFDRSKVPAGESLLQLVSVDWLKDTERMDHVARRKGCAAQVAAEKGLFTLLFNLQVPGFTHYSMVLYFVARKPISPGSLLQKFVDGDDGFRNNRLKLIPSVPKGSWIVRQSVGSTPCILGKAVDCNYYRGKRYLEVDVDIGSSTVANGVLGLVFGVVTSLVVDIAFLVQANSIEELPERLIGTVRISRLELSSAVPP